MWIIRQVGKYDERLGFPSIEVSHLFKGSFMASEIKSPDTSEQPFVHHAVVSAWFRRLTDGRTMVVGFINEPTLPDGVNDAVVRVSMQSSRLRDETANGVGKSYLDIIEEGWKTVKRPQYITVSEAIAMME
jgi:hypothetical protein